VPGFTSKTRAVISAQLSSAGADAADFVRLRLWADNGECVRQVMHAQVYRLLYAAVLPPEINAAVSKN
jgi:hypothetical protein